MARFLTRRWLYVAAAGVTALGIVAAVSPADAMTHGTRAQGRSWRLPGHGSAPGRTPSPSPSGSPSPSPSPSSSPSRSAGSTPTPTATTSRATTGVLFDDFAYEGVTDTAFTKEWSVRTERGAPGQSGAKWAASTVTFAGTGSAATMTQQATTDGTTAGTVESEVDTKASKYYLGTYATRIRFTDTPTGPAGAHVNETYFTISAHGDDGKYSEMDFEYLPAGGWGDNRRQLDYTSWTTPDDSQSTASAAGYDGWHTLVVQATATAITYWVDGTRTFTTTGKYVAREPMAVCYNTWFIDGELGPQGAARTYRQETDWTYFTANQTLTPAAVQSQVDAERAAGITATDTVS